MSDLRIDPITGDLDYQGGLVAVVTGQEALAQRIRLRLQVWRGEWFLNPDFGTPYRQQILGKDGFALIDPVLRSVILSVPGVIGFSRIPRYSYDNVTRKITVDFAVNGDVSLSVEL
jgi:hypothetical protein